MPAEINFSPLKAIDGGTTCSIYPYGDGYVIKKYNKEFLTERYSSLQLFIENLVRLRRNSDEEIQTHIDRLFTWPLDTVTENGRFCGFIMKRLPDKYTWRGIYNGRNLKIPLKMEVAFSDENFLNRRGMPVADRRGRMMISQWLIIAVRFLHSSHIVMGDISSNNIFVRFDPTNQMYSTAMFVDVDSYCGYKAPGLVNPLDVSESPGWRTPDSSEKISPAHDIYKICLAIARLYQKGKRTTMDIAGTESEYSNELEEKYGAAFKLMAEEVSPAFAAVIRKGLSYRAENRPDADDLLAVLQEGIQTAANANKKIGRRKDEAITLKLSNGTSVSCDVIGVFELHKREYIALKTRDTDPDIFFYGYRKISNTEYELRWIESVAELDAVVNAFETIE